MPNLYTFELTYPNYKPGKNLYFVATIDETTSTCSETGLDLSSGPLLEDFVLGTDEIDCVDYRPSREEIEELQNWALEVTGHG